MKFTLGLDVGIGSVGWSIIKLDEITEIPIKIEDLGIRTFNVAEVPETGKSLALACRKYRGSRKTTRRRKHRLLRLKKLLKREGIIEQERLDKIKNLDVWQLRAEALERKLDKNELGKIILHITKHRGFKSNRKSEIKDKELGKVLKGVAENSNHMLANNYLTIGEMFYKDEKFKNKKRNEKDDYSYTVLKKDLENELKIIFHCQRKYGNNDISEELEDKIIDIFNSQRHYASGDQILKMIRYCTFEKEERRCPKSTYTFQRFMLLNKINTLVIREQGEDRFLNQEERDLIINLAYEQQEIKYKTLRLKLKLNSEARFKGLVYGKKDVKEVEKCNYIYLKDYHDLRKEFEKHNIDIKELDIDLLDHIGCALTIYKEDVFIKQYLSEHNVPLEVIGAALNVNFSKVGHLSLVSIKKILPYMEQGQSYYDACVSAGYANVVNANKQKLLPIKNEKDDFVFEDITNPVVLRAVTQTRKVVNNIIRQYGSPISVHVELSRDMNRTYKERKIISKNMDSNRLKNEAAIKSIKELQNLPYYTGLDIVKMKLWKDQQGICPYSIGEKNNYIDISRLLEPGYVQVDHIIPYSKSFNDSYDNKVLVFTHKNQEKGNKTPYEFFGNNTEKWQLYTEWVKKNIKSNFKVNNLLKKHYTNEDEKEFKSRNLNDTRYISRYVKNYIEQYLLFAPSEKMKRRVYTVNGSVTSYIRKRWGLEKNRNINDRHHALDATVVALVSPSMIQKVTAHVKFGELNYSKKMAKGEQIVDPFTGELFTLDEFSESLSKNFPLPWRHFREELLIRLNSEDPIKDLKQYKWQTYVTNDDFKNVKPLFVSRMPDYKVIGQGHEETLMRLRNKTVAIKKVHMSKAKFDVNGDWNMYCKESDPYTYNAVKQRYLENKSDKDKAFIEPLYKSKKDGSQGNVIKTVKIEKPCNTGVYFDELKAVAANGGICRVDIFKKNNKYYMVALYNHEIVNKKISNLIIKAGEPDRSKWATVDDSYEFMFSLFKNDLVRIIKRGEEIWGYYRSACGDQPRINIDKHDINISGMSKRHCITTLDLFEKYTIDVLGNKYLVKGEKRRGLEKSNNN
jgi:CRISPR-associated endonuclease Csn1